MAIAEQRIKLLEDKFRRLYASVTEILKKNSGDQTSIVGITGTKAEYNISLTDGDFLFVGDVTQYTDENAQDAVGNILLDSATIDFSYSDGTPSITATVKPDSITATELSNTINVSEFVNDAGYEANTIETLSSTGGTISITPVGDNRNLEVVQATELQLGGGKIATQVTIEDNTTTNDIDIVTSKKFWFGINKFISLPWTWTLKQTFTTAPRLSSTTPNTVPYIDTNKDVISSAVTPTELGYLSGVTSSIQTQLNGKEPTITGTGLVTDFWAGNKTFRDLATDVRAVILTGFNSLITWARVTTATSIQNAISLLQRQLNYLQSTRIISGVGVTANADPTKFDIAIVGEIVDINTFVPTPISVNTTGILATYRTLQTESYVWVDNTGTVIQSLTPPDPINLDSVIGYWVLVHSNLSTINLINSFPYYADGVATKINQILYYLGFAKFKATNIVSPGTIGTRITHTGGNVIKSGGGNLSKRPVFALTGAIDDTFRMRNRDDVEGADTQTMDVTNIDIAGVTTLLANNRFAVAKVWKFSSSFIRIQRGQKSYANYDDAATGLHIDGYVDSPNGLRNGIHIGWIIFRKGTSWGIGGTGVDGVDYKFVDALVSGATGSVTPSMQVVYNVSLPNPEITTNATQGAITFRQGSGLDTDSVLEIQNGVGTTTSSITGAGTGFFRSLTLRNIANTFTGTWQNAITAARTWTLPDASGDIALISQVITNGVTVSAPSEDAVFDALALKEALANKATNLTSPDNTKYPTTLAVTNGLLTKMTAIDIAGAVVNNVYVYNGVINKPAGSGLININITALGFTTIRNVTVTVERTSTSIADQAHASITATPTVTNLSLAITESKNTGILIGGNVEGLEFTTATCNLHITINGTR